VVIQASARKAAEEATPERVDGEGQWVPSEIAQRSGVPAKSRSDFVRWF